MFRYGPGFLREDMAEAIINAEIATNT